MLSNVGEVDLKLKSSGVRFAKDANVSFDDFIRFFEKHCFAFFAEGLGKLIAIGKRK